MQTNSSFAVAPTTTAAIYPWDLKPTPILSTGFTATPSRNPWTNLQPGLNPPPSVPSGFQWIPIATSAHTVHVESVLSSRHTPVTNHSTSTVTSHRYSNVSRTFSSAMASETSCGDVSAQFAVDFDDLPFFSTGPDDVDIPPIFNPYRKLYWEGHFGYVPPPTDPFPPHSPPQLAIYRARETDLSESSDAGLELHGEVGAGPRAEYNAYWIDAYSAWLGCANGGPHSCVITINGYKNGGEMATVTQSLIKSPCPGLKNCSLTLTNFDSGFRGLSGLQILAAVDGTNVDYYMDDLLLGWSNNSCAAQSLRSSSE